MTEKPGNFVASFKSTVMITKGKTTALTGLTIDDTHFKTEHSIKDEKILGLLTVIISLILAINVKVIAKESKKTVNNAKLKLTMIFKLLYSFLLILKFFSSLHYNEALNHL
jgi:hypothetical protein